MRISRHALIGISVLSFAFFLTACGGGGGGGGGTTNTNPLAAAGSDQTVTEGDTVTLAGSGSDAEGAITFSWTQTSGTPVTLSDPTIAGPTFTAPMVSATEILVFQLTVTDKDGASTSDTVSITVADSSNTIPVVNAGPDQTVTEGDTVTLAGSGSDAEGPVTFSWTQTSGTTVALSDPTIAGPTFTAPMVSSTETLVFTLTVTDSAMVSVSDSVAITVNDTGGGGGSRRIKQIRYDYDNNGVPEVISTISYDTAGRITTIASTYTDDGVADKFNITGQGIDNQLITIGYDGAGRVTSFSEDDTTSKADFTYTYTAGLLTRADLTTLDAGVTDSIYFLYDYTGETMNGWTMYLTADDSVLSTRAFTYGSAGLPEVDLYSFGFVEKITYTWRTDGQLDLRESDAGNDGSVETVYDFDYDTAGRLTTEKRSSSFADPSINVTITESYDGTGAPLLETYDLAPEDMVTDASVTFTLEDGPCTAVYVWFPGAIPNYIKPAGLPYTPGTGFSTFPTCVK